MVAGDIRDKNLQSEKGDLRFGRSASETKKQTKNKNKFFVVYIILRVEFFSEAKRMFFWHAQKIQTFLLNQGRQLYPFVKARVSFRIQIVM